jgi:hypothetical protein
VSAERIPRGKPPNFARRGEVVATKTQKLRPALSCEPLPNHVLPLAHFGAISDVCDGGMVRTDHHNAGERGKWEHPTLRPGGSPCIYLLMAGKQSPSQVRHLPLPPHWSEQRKASYLTGTDKQSRAGMKVVFDVTRYLEGGHIF